MRNYDRKTITHTAEGQTFEFRCYTDDLRDGYIERATMCDPFTLDLYKGTCRVWNRPWQSYTYQTACVSAVAQAIQEEKALLLWVWKNAHGYERMSQRRRAEYEGSEASTSDRLKALLTLQWIVADRIPHFGPTLGYRERDILDNLANVEHTEHTEEHDLYRLTSTDGNTFVWDQATKKIVG